MIWRRALLPALAGLLIASAALEIYARVPSRVGVAPLGLGRDTRVAILLFHGRGGRGEPTLVALEQRFRSLAASRPGTAVQLYVWEPWSETRFRSAANGVHIGAALGEELSRLPGLQAVHLVGHSAGAYVLDALCERLKAEAGRPIQVDATFLDPIGFAGAFDIGWGARHYGACADYAEAFINTDDFVPATNAPLAHAFNIDVTAAPGRASFSGDGHRWPVRYYLGQLGIDDVIPAAHEHLTRPRGAVERRR